MTYGNFILFFDVILASSFVVMFIAYNKSRHVASTVPDSAAMPAV